MALSSINTNIAAYSAQGNIGRASTNAGASIARLSSGNRITKASDDVAALAAGTSLRTLVTTLKTALLNASQGSSMLQVADGALNQLSEILQRQKAIAVQAGSGSLSDTQRGFLNQEFQALAAQIDQIAAGTNFNGVALLNGGLGAKTSLANTGLLAAAFDPTATTGSDAAPGAVKSTSAIQAFNKASGAELEGTAAAGELEVADSAGTLLTNAQFLTVPSNVYGQFDNWRVENVNYGAGAVGTGTLKVDLNGVTYSAAINGASTTAIIGAGTSYFEIKFTAISMLNAGTVNLGVTTVNESFRNTAIYRTSTLNGVNFEGTRLQGVVGHATTGIAMLRLNGNPSEAAVENFRVTSWGTANSTNIAVDINGETFTATNVLDATVTTGILVFSNGSTGEALTIDLTGLDTDFDAVGTDSTQRDDLIEALQIGFSRVNGAGANFSVGASSSENINVSLGSATSTVLYGGSALSVGSAADAAVASSALDTAINRVTTIRSTVGALQSRFNFASANLESSIQNEDAARGVLLDTDVASESTAYATAQVQLQAGIAVLAQANLLPQNLLKLIG